MAAEENIALMRKGYEAFSQGDMDTVRGLFDPDIVWHSPGQSSISGDHTGADSVLAHFGKLATETAGTYRVEVVEMLSSDERVVVIQHSNAARKGKTIDEIHPVVWMLRDGKPYDVTVFHYDMGAHDDFWG